MKLNRIVAAWLLIPVVLSGFALYDRWHTPLRDFPSMVLWAWERPERLEFLEQRRDVAVAYLTATLFLAGDTVIIRSRHQPLRVPPQIPLLAVIRVERDHQNRPTLSSLQRDQAVGSIVALIGHRKITGVQVDFEAAVSERNFYRQFITELRRRLPTQQSLSVTALASWCTDDIWMQGLPVDEVVPMAYSMGVDNGAIRRRLARQRDFGPSYCRSSIGVATDESLPWVPRGRRVYLFNAKPWTKQEFERMEREVSKWQR
jgi:hypothetical protein